MCWRGFTITLDGVRQRRPLRRFEPDEYYRLDGDLILLAQRVLPEEGEDLDEFVQGP